VQAPLPLRDSPGGQTGHDRPFRHGAGRLNSALCTGFVFLKGWKNERELFFSGEGFSLVDDTLEDGDGCDDAVPVSPTCEAELPELWLLVELTDPPEPPEKLLCEETELAEPPEEPPWEEPPPPPPPEECCARRVVETTRIAATTRPESRIKHLAPDGREPGQTSAVLFNWTAIQRQRIPQNSVDERK